ncbi:MAG: DUF4249 domain-containing protein [Crocinitomicaceae bacterium]|nr:DUF4249 domain-containing protein [Crocinitomicaceae bacterium]
MRYTFYSTLFLMTIIAVSIFGCTKEVTIDIPGYEEQLVIDGRIETGQPPIIFISKSSEVYAPTNVDAFLNGFVSGALVSVSNDITTIQLDEICSDNLPAGSEDQIAALLGIPVDQLSNYNLCAYTSLNPAIWGEVGKTYDLTVTLDGQSYTAQTSIVQPTMLDSLYWKPEGNSSYGFSWCTLSDSPNQFDAYKWEIKRINTNANGEPTDANFTAPDNPVFDDQFFDGLTFDFFYDNPHGGGPGVPDQYSWHYFYGDSVVIKLSKMDEQTYEFMEKKYTQLATAGNPFATPTNIPTNLSGGALGVWAGYSPSFDTLWCVP